MDWITILERCIWFGSAALGFAILFNVPPRTLLIIWLLGAIGGFVKLNMLNLELGPVLASFLGASVIGLLSIPAAHNKHAPPLVFSIPAVIPMVPGVFFYRMMLGFIKLTGDIGDSYNQVLSETVNNGVKALFILMALAVGVGIPNFITRKESAKEIKIKKKRSAIA
ncbi:MAG: threonine/serine exporter family protein [Bacteroidota bacterium]|nr:threonine/serine exporter family protein [Bacteroidota bacterium]